MSRRFKYLPLTLHTPNLLPEQGDVRYHGPVLSSADADRFFSALIENIEWQHDEVVMFGKTVVTARKVSWHGNAGCDYAYAGRLKKAKAWTGELLELRARVQECTGVEFNSVLLNLYHHGGEGMGWHTDDEAALGPNNTIASLSLGAERRFCFRHKTTRQTIQCLLEHGSLLVMSGSTQSHWQHSLPKSAQVKTPRINLTFRRILSQTKAGGC